MYDSSEPVPFETPAVWGHTTSWQKTQWSGCSGQIHADQKGGMTLMECYVTIFIQGVCCRVWRRCWDVWDYRFGYSTGGPSRNFARTQPSLARPMSSLWAGQPVAPQWITTILALHQITLLQYITITLDCITMMMLKLKYHTWCYTILNCICFQSIQYIYTYIM